jgi:hypothetical protein
MRGAGGIPGELWGFVGKEMEHGKAGDSKLSSVSGKWEPGHRNKNACRKRHLSSIQLTCLRPSRANQALLSTHISDYFAAVSPVSPL